MRRPEGYPRHPIWYDQLSSLVSSHCCGEAETFGIPHRHPGRVSTAEEVHRKPGADGGNQERFKSGRMVLWLAILWTKSKELTPQVRGQLEMVTKEVGPRYVFVSDGFGAEEDRGCIDSVQHVVH